MSNSVDVGDEELASPAVTPGCSFDEEKYLVAFKPPVTRKRFKWLVWIWKDVPFAILAASVLQIFFHIFSTPDLRKLLRFEPSKQQQIWRFITYMLVHDDWLHLSLNVIMQCLFAMFLEKPQGRLRVVLLYLLAGLTGVLGASCVHPDLVIGASAGVYALLISNLAHIALNYQDIKYKACRCVCIGVMVIFDIIFNIVHSYSKDEPLISWMAHLVGGITGLLMGFVLFRRGSNGGKLVNLSLFWTGLILYSFLMFCLVIMVFQIKKCTPSSIIRYKYVYFC